MTNDKIATLRAQSLKEIRARHEAGERGSADADREWLLGEVERLSRERDEARAERDTLLLDAREVVRWCAKPTFPPWCAIHDRIKAHANTLAAIDAAMAKIGKEGGR